MGMAVTAITPTNDENVNNPDFWGVPCLPLSEGTVSGFVPKGFGACSERLRSVFEKASEHEPKGFGANGSKMHSRNVRIF